MKRQISYYHQPGNALEIIHAKNSRTSYPLHNHVATCVIGLLLKGEIILTRENEKILLSPQALFIIPPYEPHAITAGSMPYDLLSICLHKNLLETSCPDTLKKQVWQHLTGILPPETREDIDYPALERAIDLVMRHHKHAPSKAENKRLGMLRANMEARTENRISIEEMAETVCASKYHFIRQFKKNAGLTPHRFQIQNRVRKAQKMLPHATSLTDVALITGFYDQSHLIRHFRKILGMTPREYIRACQALPE